MPNPLDFLRKYQTPSITSDQQAEQDARATAFQSNDPTWMQYGRAGIDATTDALRGLTGIGDQGPPGATVTNIAALGGAMLPFKNPLANILSKASSAASTFRPAVTQLGKLAIPSIERVKPTIPMETLGEALPEFTPVGGEGMLNAARQGLRPNIPNPIESTYGRILQQGGADINKSNILTGVKVRK